MPDPIGVAVIGTGSIAEAHLYAYAKAGERCHVVAVADGVEDRAKRAAERRHTSDGDMDVPIVGVPPQETEDVHFD
jgi:predicted dehydrogenase